ncbi:(5-formylfuran-3-yl)methyl phosphate synthase [Anatilimnocola sp. NA78]|uniref:(5-formylfuran-3-yl)methyl phosphate synthase n=1 Tax=Anatilimnocola sp. NA78 TaxID=3415683 RepID=UPI003CE4F800
MTRLLVSVTSAQEAIVAAENGADLIDIKDPQQGSLGAADPQVWREAIAAIGDNFPVSAALGELLDEQSLARAQQTSGLIFAKVGLAGCGSQDQWRTLWMKWQSSLASGTQAVAVIYADWHVCAAPPPADVLQLAIDQQAAAILVDTFDKSRGSLWQCYEVSELAILARAVQQAKLKLVLAGSLQLTDLPQLLPLRPDYIAVRGAVCNDSRTSNIDPAKVRAWSQALRDATNDAR